MTSQLQTIINTSIQNKHNKKTQYISKTKNFGAAECYKKYLSLQINFVLRILVILRLKNLLKKELGMCEQYFSFQKAFPHLSYPTIQL